MPGRVAATSRLRSLHHRGSRDATGSRDAATLTRIVSSYREATAKRSGCRSVAAGRTRSGGDAPLASSLSHAAAHARTGVEIPAKLIAPSPRRVSKPRPQHTRSINDSETFEAKLVCWWKRIDPKGRRTLASVASEAQPPGTGAHQSGTPAGCGRFTRLQHGGCASLATGSFKFHCHFVAGTECDFFPSQLFINTL